MADTIKLSPQEVEDMWLTMERKRAETMKFKFVVSSMGTVLRIDAQEAFRWEVLGVEIFDDYLSAAKRFTDGDESRRPLMYFEEI